MGYTRRCTVCGYRLSVTHMEGEYASDDGHGRAYWRPCKPATEVEKAKIREQDAGFDVMTGEGKCGCES